MCYVTLEAPFTLSLRGHTSAGGHHGRASVVEGHTCSRGSQWQNKWRAEGAGEGDEGHGQEGRTGRFSGPADMWPRVLTVPSQQAWGVAMACAIPKHRICWEETWPHLVRGRVEWPCPPPGLGVLWTFRQDPQCPSLPPEPIHTGCHLWTLSHASARSTEPQQACVHPTLSRVPRRSQPCAPNPGLPPGPGRQSRVCASQGRCYGDCINNPLFMPLSPKHQGRTSSRNGRAGQKEQ